MKGAEVVSITHVAYKSKKVRVGQGGRVTLEDADFDVPEITVTKKPLVYAQTYYRMVYQNDDPDLPVYYYRAGVLNNSYDKKTKNRIDEDGNYAPEDFIMSQRSTTYDDEKNNGSHTNIMMQVFTVDRAYVTKDELKQLKKENKMKMTYQNLQQFERGHKIPPLPAEIQKRINEAMK